MPQIAQLVAISLEGTPPAELNLAPLSSCSRSVEAVMSALTPFCRESARLQRICRLSHLKPAGELTSGLTVVYMVGHAWTTPGGYSVAIRDGAGSAVLSGESLADALNSWFDADSSAVLFVDTCEAEAFEAFFGRIQARKLTAIFASSQDEEAWSLVADSQTRFAAQLALILGRPEFSKRARPILDLALEISKSIESETVLFPQTVSYFVRGGRILLSPAAQPSKRSASPRTLRRVRRRLMLGGAVLAALLFLAGLYWRGHVLVFIDLGELSRLAQSGVIEVYQQNPDENSSERIDQHPWSGESAIWRRLPARNLVIAVRVFFDDGQPRAIRFHKEFQPGMTTQKWIRLRLPDWSEIAARPRMAFVFADSWKQGETQKPGPKLRPFWIDLRPLTVSEHLDSALSKFRAGGQQPYESFLIWHLYQIGIPEEKIRTATGRELQGAYDSESSLLSCPNCPAPMTLIEAAAVAESHGKRLPLPEEWELAVRGVDGRTYPWGNRIDRDLINAGLPRNVGEATGLRPVDASGSNAASPFGLTDTVGNAGDWVAYEDGYAAFMGGVFRMNPEDCTTYSMTVLPSSQTEIGPLHYWTIAYRGVASSALPPKSSP